MDRTEKERVVAELAEQLRSVESLIVADYRGLTNTELEELRGKLRPHGARLTVVKNTLTRRAAEAAGAEALLALLEGPTAIAFVEAEGDPVAAAKALAEAARQTKIMTLRGGILPYGAGARRRSRSCGRRPFRSPRAAPPGSPPGRRLPVLASSMTFIPL